MTDEEFNRRFDQLHESIRDSEARTLETMRDMQTEILRAGALRGHRNAAPAMTRLGPGRSFQICVAITPLSAGAARKTDCN
jgi:hypothetical protein